MKKIGLRLLLIIGTFLALSFQVFVPALRAESPPVIEVKQGEMTWIKTPFPGNQPFWTGKFLGKKIYFNRLNEPGQYGALLGVDLDEKPSENPLSDMPEKAVFALVQIVPNPFEVQEVKVAPQYVDPSPQQLRRINQEKREMQALLSVISEKKQWQGNFTVPVKGIREGRFGSRRIFNGEARRPHNGEDIAAPEKTPVYAPNDGVVVGVVNHFFSGKGVILDHGQGFFTEYFHLYKTRVKKGEKVKKGKLIGLVGHTGRATGPHLHWGMVINGARVNPFSVVNLNLE